ncbi:MAG: pilus assembly protein [Alphaproteobacteria bacterium]|nr:pilus assembly protein [Alphaproteobacteria bacterium]
MRDRKGSPALEFALMAPVFFGTLLLAFEILYAIAAKSVIDTALDDSSRTAVTGGANPTDTAARRVAFETNFYAISDPLITRANLTLGIAACASAAQLTASPASCRTNDPGATGEIVQFSATYRHQFLAQAAVCGLLGISTCPSITMHAQLVRRNEPF